MFEVTIIKTFSSAHQLADIGGKCEELHGHNFKVEVTVGAPRLNSDGLLIDFRLVKKWLKDILDEMDHQHLNDLPFFCRQKSLFGKYRTLHLYFPATEGKKGKCQSASRESMGIGKRSGNYSE